MALVKNRILFIPFLAFNIPPWHGRRTTIKHVKERSGGSGGPRGAPEQCVKTRFPSFRV